MTLVKFLGKTHKYGLNLFFFFFFFSFFLREWQWQWGWISWNCETEAFNDICVCTFSLCQIMIINNNKPIYRQSQVLKPNNNRVQWAECSLFIGAGHWVHDFNLIIDSLVGLSVGSLLEIRFQRPWVRIAFSRGRQFVSFRFENRLPGPLKTTNKSIARARYESQPVGSSGLLFYSYNKNVYVFEWYGS